jgi:endonuclease/exonuclease/phosphatase family metal-dependent hydrolase
MLPVIKRICFITGMFYACVMIHADNIKLYSFNIQVYGVSKSAKPEVMAVLADIISGADIVAVQEVRAVDLLPVERMMAMLPARFRYVLGPREGRSQSKEQYWVIYDGDKFTVLEKAAYPDPGDKFERNPFAVFFQTNTNNNAGDQAFDFILINNHIKPGDAAAEINALRDVITYYQALWHESDVITVGDFNADGSYYNEKMLARVFPGEDFGIIINNEQDTTTAQSSNTYDRIIITKSAVEDFTGNSGVIRFDGMYDWQALKITPQMVSDHFPVWAEFYTDRDSD